MNAKIVLKDPDWRDNFENDDGIAIQYNRDLHELHFFDTVKELEDQALLYLPQNLSHIYTIMRGNLYLQVFMIPHTLLDVDQLAFQLGHMVNAVAIAVKQMCYNCKSKSPRLKMCMACCQAYYCDEECQKAARPLHKKFCEIIKKDRDDNCRGPVRRDKDMNVY
jgi:hypothetical protein